MSARIRWFAGALLVAGAMGSFAAEPEADARLRVVDYRPDLVLPLTAFVGYHVHFEFAPGERFVNLGSGDTASLDVGAEANHLLLKAKAPLSGTNLTILTNERVYFLDFRALGRAPRPGEAVYSIAFRYPTPATVQPVAVDTAAAQRLDPLPPPVNRDYWFCGSSELRPVTAMDDGVQARFTFPPQALLPAIYARESDGAETLVNSHVEQDTVVVHRLAERFILRRGRLVGCIVNKGSGAGVRRATSGTVDPLVGRATTAVQP